MKKGRSINRPFELIRPNQNIIAFSAGCMVVAIDHPLLRCGERFFLLKGMREGATVFDTTKVAMIV